MPLRRNNNDPMPVLAPLPGEQYEENLPDVVTDPGLQSPMDFETGYDRINGLDAYQDVPQQVVEDSYNMPETEVRRATPALQNEGSFFDLSYINDFRAAYQQALQQTGDPAKAVEMVRPIAQSWTPAQRHVYERTEGYAEVDPKYAAGLVQDWYAQQDRQATQVNDPKYQAQLETERTRARGLSEQSISNARQAAETSDRLLKIMDRLRGGPREGKNAVAKGEEVYRGRVGPFDSSVPNAMSFSGGKREGWFADFKALQDTLGLAEARLNKGQGNMTESERAMLRDAATGGLNYNRDDESFSTIFEDMYSMFQQQAERNKAALSAKEGNQQSAAPAAAQDAPSAAPPASPAPTPAPASGFQPGKLYKDAAGRQSMFQGYDKQGNPVFVRTQ